MTSFCSIVPLLLFVVVVLLAMAYACNHYQKWAAEGFSNPRASLHDAPVASATIDGPAPLGYTMGDYDGIPIRTECEGGWKNPPCTAPLSESSRNETVYGHNIPLSYEFTNTVNDFPTAPPIDGSPNQPRSDFMFAYNKMRERSTPLPHHCIGLVKCIMS